MNKVLESPFLKVVLFAILIRIILMPFLFHPDLKTQYYHASLLGKGVVNIYDFVKNNKGTLLYKDTFNYPPLTYFSLGGYIYLVNPLLGNNFREWENQWGENWFSDLKIFKLLFVLNLPYLFFDVLIGLLLVKFLEDKYKKLALLFWFFNPINIYIIYGIANFDVVICYFSLLALYFYKNKKFFFSGVGLGVGIALKLFPILFIPFFILPLVLKRDYKQLVYFLGGLAIFPVLTLLPFINELMGLNSSGLISKILEIKIGFLGLPVFYLYFFVIILFFCKELLAKKEEWKLVNKYLVYFLLTLFLFTNYHPQWLLWVMPFFALMVGERKELFLSYLLLMIGFFIHLLIFEDRFLTTGIISPIIKNVYDFDFIEQALFLRFPKNLIVITGDVIFLLGIVGLFFNNLKVKFRYLDKMLSLKNILIIMLLSDLLLLFSFVTLAVYFGSKKVLVDEQPISVADLSLIKGHDLHTEINNKGNLTQLYIKVKNINLRNEEGFNVDIKDPISLESKTFNLSGRNIGDNDWVRLKFNPINFRSNKLVLILSSETTNRDKELRVNVNADKNITFKAYGQRSMSDTLKNFIIDFYNRFLYDKYFATIYFLLIVLSILGLVGIRKKSYVD